MALSRFWSWMIAISAMYIFYLLAVDRMYSLNGLVNGKQNDPVLVAEYPLSNFESDTAFVRLLQETKLVGFTHSDGKGYKLLDNGTVELSAGRQSADGIFPTCKNTIMDI